MNATWDPFGTLHTTLWIGGGQWAGKSTVARLLAMRFGLTAYHYDFHDARAHQDRRIARRARLGEPIADPDPDSVWVNTSPDEMADGTLAGFPVRFEWALDDLRGLVSGRPIVAEGWGLRPELVAPIIDSPRRMIVMVPTEEFRERQVRELPRATAVFHGVSDPERAQHNRLARDRPRRRRRRPYGSPPRHSGARGRWARGCGGRDRHPGRPLQPLPVAPRNMAASCCQTPPMAGDDLSEPEYLRHIELLVRDLVAAANDEGWLVYGEQTAGLTRLQRMITELAHQIRHYHFDGDGCIDPELPDMRLAGVVVLKPDAVPPGMEGTYGEICGRLGIEARPEGWAVWNAWAGDGQPIHIVLVDLDGTEGILLNWERGIEVYPVAPLPAQVVLTRQGWVKPMTLSPFSVRKLGANRPNPG